MLRKPQDISKVQYYKNMVSPLHRVSPTKFDALDGQTDRGIVFLLIIYTKNYSFKKIFHIFVCVCMLFCLDGNSSACWLDIKRPIVLTLISSDGVNLQAQEELWLECAQRLTAVIQQIIEFAKMVPGFMRLSQDDQIVLLKTGEFSDPMTIHMCI
jgi:hypothetical protein